MSILASIKRTTFNALLLLCMSFAGTAGAFTVVVNPGSVGTTFANLDVPFTDLNGATFASGQTLSIDFVLPTGINAKYRYDGIGTQTLYGWSAALYFAGSPTVVSQPFLSNVRPFDVSGAPVGPNVGSIVLYNNTFAAYVANYNSQYSNSNLLAFTNTQYHGVHMDITLPTFAQSTVTISSASFGFNRNGSGEFTELVAAAPIPEPETYAMMLAGLGLLSVITRRRNQQGEGR